MLIQRHRCKIKSKMKFLLWTTIILGYVFIYVNMEVATSNTKRILVRRIRKLPKSQNVSTILNQEEINSIKRKMLTKKIVDISANQNYSLAINNLKKSIGMLSSLHHQRRVEKYLDEGDSGL